MTQQVAEQDQPAASQDAVPDRLTDWKNEPSLADILQELELVRPAHKLHLAKITTWLDHLNITGSAKYTPPAGRSGVQPQLIRKHAEWRYADLSEPFLTSDRVFTVSPRTWKDREAAEQNQAVLNWQFDTQLNKVAFVDQFVRRAVDEGTVLVRLGWEREVVTEEVMAPTYSYFPMNSEEAQALQGLMAQAEQDPEMLQSLHPEIQESVRYSQENQGFFRAKRGPDTKTKVEKLIKNQPVVELADIRNFLCDPSCGSNYRKAMFMSYSYEVSLATLRKDPRYKNLDGVTEGTSNPLQEPDHVRPTEDKTSTFNFTDKARQLVVLNEYWGYFDINNDNTLVPILVSWIGDRKVRCEVNEFPDRLPPFVIVPLLPIDKSPYGASDGSLLIDNQRIVGAVTRGMIDILARSASGQRGMAKGMLDVVNKRRFDSGQDYEFNPNIHPQQGVVNHVFPEIPSSAPGMIQSCNYEAESLTGTKVFGDQGLSGASLGPTAAGAKGMLSAAGRRTNGILRRLAKGLSDVGEKIVAMNQEFLTGDEVIQVTDEDFVQVDREKLKGNFDFKVDISSAEEDEARASRLEFMLQTMGNTGDPGVTKLLLSQTAKLRRMPDLAKKIEDFEPQPDPVKQKQQELEVARLEAEIAEMNAKAARYEAEAEKTRAEARVLGSKADNEDLQYVNDSTGTTHRRKMEEIGAQADANTKHTITKAILNQKNGHGPDGKVDNTPTRQDIHDAVQYNAQG